MNRSLHQFCRAGVYNETTHAWGIPHLKSFHLWYVSKHHDSVLLHKDRMTNFWLMMITFNYLLIIKEWASMIKNIYKHWLAHNSLWLIYRLQLQIWPKLAALNQMVGSPKWDYGGFHVNTTVLLPCKTKTPERRWKVYHFFIWLYARIEKLKMKQLASLDFKLN